MRWANDIRLVVLVALLALLVGTQAGPVLYRLTIILPTALVVLIAAGVLHRPRPSDNL